MPLAAVPFARSSNSSSSSSTNLAPIIAGAIGGAVAALAGLGVVALVRRRRRAAEPAGGSCGSNGVEGFPSAYAGHLPPGGCWGSAVVSWLGTGSSKECAHVLPGWAPSYWLLASHLCPSLAYPPSFVQMPRLVHLLALSPAGSQLCPTYVSSWRRWLSSRGLPVAAHGGGVRGRPSSDGDGWCQCLLPDRLLPFVVIDCSILQLQLISQWNSDRDSVEAAGLPMQ